MIIKLNIQEDKDLRKDVRDLIKGQVLSLTREELNKDMIGEVISKKAGHKIREIEEAIDAYHKVVEHGSKEGIKKLKGVFEGGAVRCLVKSELLKFIEEQDLLSFMQKIMREEISAFVTENFSKMLK